MHQHGHGRKRAVRSDPWQFRSQPIHDLLDKKIAKGNSTQPIQAIVNGVKDCRITLIRGEHRGRNVDQRRQIAGQPPGERD